MSPSPESIKGGEYSPRTVQFVPISREKDLYFDMSRLIQLCIFGLLVLVLALLHSTAGHGMLMNPVSRSSRWRFNASAPINYNDNENFCGGFDVRIIHFSGCPCPCPKNGYCANCKGSEKEQEQQTSDGLSAIMKSGRLLSKDKESRVYHRSMIIIDIDIDNSGNDNENSIDIRSSPSSGSLI